MLKSDTEYSTLVNECAEQGKALARQMAGRGDIQTLYLYFRPGGPEKSGRLMIAREDAPNPEGLQKVTNEGLRSNIPYESYFQWVFERARRTPILAVPARE